MTAGKFLLIVLLQVYVFTGATGQAMERQAATDMTIIIEPVYNGQQLALTDQPYVNNQGDTLYIDLFRFYITNMKLMGTEAFVTDSCSHLVDAERIGSCTFNIKNVMPGRYTSLQFTVGVDSIANTNGANSGDLDPVKGMYWAWNTGYIMAKLEGRSNICKTLHHAFEFHIGGYMPPYNAARTVSVPLAEAIEIKSGEHNVIRIKADAAAWFNNVSLARTNNIVIPGREACMIADNYASMFSIAH